MKTHRVTLLHRNGGVTIRGGVLRIASWEDKSVSMDIANPYAPFGVEHYATMLGHEVDRVIVVPEG